MTPALAYKSSVQLGVQGGLCFGLSLILGGMCFAGVMRRFGFTTLIDPFEARFGRRWAAVLALPALAAEVFWSAELLVAIGSTFGVLLGLGLTQAVLFSAVVTTAYTVLGGMLPFVLDGSGGLAQAWTASVTARPRGAGVLPPVRAVAAATGLLLLPLVSRLTTRWDPPRALRRPAGDGD